MSSRKKRNNDPNNGVGSNRNLDGRRLRTITEAKSLAEYLATKPEMDRREKEERRKKWVAVVEAAERREEEIRSGKKGKGLSEEWVDEKEDAGERTRDAVKKAMMQGDWRDSVGGRQEVGEASGSGSGSGGSREASEVDEEDVSEEEMDLDDNEMKILEKEAADGDVDAIWVLKNKIKKPQAPRRFLGFDDDDEFLSSDSEKEDIGKGKSKA